MKKLKIILILLFIPFFIFMSLAFLRIKNHGEFQQKVALAYEIRKVLGTLMFDLSQARENTILDVPADGLWHNRVAFTHAQQGIMEYVIQEGRLFRVNKGSRALIADHI